MEVSKDDIAVTIPLSVNVVEGQRRFFLGKLDLTSQLSEEDLLALADCVDGDETDLEAMVSASGNYSPATRDYFDRSFGNWLPGDPEELELVSIKFGDLEIVDHATEAMCTKVDEILCEQARDWEPDYPDDFDDREADEERV